MKRIECKIALFVGLVFLGFCSAMGQNRTISGTITDRGTGETLIGVKVVDRASGKGATTNAFGRFSLTLRQGEVQLLVTFSGYEPVEDTFLLAMDTVMNFTLAEKVTMLQAVVVRGERPTDATSSQMSAVNVPIEHIKAVPVLFGEADVLKAIQLMPGVQSGSEGSSGMYVRGGRPDENLFLLDGVPLYNVNHLFGFFSAFNDDAIKDVTLYKGSFPARFGGRLSSVLDITANDGNSYKLHGGVSVGLVSAKFFLEGPIQKDKTTFSISARRTYADILLQPFLPLLNNTSIVDGGNVGYYFYDLNGKLSHRFSDRSRLFLNFYWGDDKVYLKFKTNDVRTNMKAAPLFEEKVFMKMGYTWGNLVGSARWNYVLSPRLFMNVTGAYTRYRNNMTLGLESYSFLMGQQQEQTMGMDMDFNSGIHDLTARVDFDYQPNPDHLMKFGTSYIHHIFTPEVFNANIDGYEGTDYTLDTTMGQTDPIHADELNLYVEDDWTITSTVKLNAGLNLSGFAVQGAFYPSLQPRLSGRVLLSDDLSFKAGYAYTTQYMHLLSNSSVSMPTDLWVPVTARVEPMNAHQIAAGLFFNWASVCDLSVEGYYKKMNHLMEYKDGASFGGSSEGWEDKVTFGQGWAYGVELLAQRTVGQFTGWVGYTWSKAERQFDEISGGVRFPAKYDRRHDVSIVLMYKPSDRFDCSLSWVYCTGNTATLSLQNYEPAEQDDYTDPLRNSLFSADQGGVSYYEHRNNYRLPAYHRMDASVNFHRQKKHGKATWNLSVYNLYNRHNPYMIYASTTSIFSIFTGEVSNSTSLKQLSIFPIIPSVSYSFKF